LHGGDLELVRSGKLPLTDLITIRRGELAHTPLTGRIEPVPAELVKIRGIGQEWRCCYYDTVSQGCSIYENRPLACGALKCWQPEETLALIGKDLLGRLDILEEGNPLRSLVLEHELACPPSDMREVEKSLTQPTGGMLQSLEMQVNTDIVFRNRVVREHNLSLGSELFLFGRPFFQLLQGLGVGVSESSQGLKLTVR
jgi:hypothetical protein